MSDEVDFVRVAKLFEVLRHAHDHGLPYRNIFMAAKEELDAIDKSLAPKPVQITVGKQSTPTDEEVEFDDEEEDDE